MILRFSHTDGGLVAKAGDLKGFIVAGADRQWQPAQARIAGDTVIVSSPAVQQPLAARYAWENSPVCTLCNGALEDVSRAEVGDIVPARSLIWATEFYRCCACGHVFWEGTHWHRIRAVRERLFAQRSQPAAPPGAPQPFETTSPEKQ
jgi:uncharacterized protein with PIN domain